MRQAQVQPCRKRAKHKRRERTASAFGYDFSAAPSNLSKAPCTAPHSHARLASTDAQRMMGGCVVRFPSPADRPRLSRRGARGQTVPLRAPAGGYPSSPRSRPPAGGATRAAPRRCCRRLRKRREGDFETLRRDGWHRREAPQTQCAPAWLTTRPAESMSAPRSGWNRNHLRQRQKTRSLQGSSHRPRMVLAQERAPRTVF